MRFSAGNILAAAVMAAICAGCQTPAPKIAGPANLPADEDSAAFLDRMSSQAAVSENDAMRGILLVLEGADKHATFTQRADALKARGVVSRQWDLEATRPLTRGRLAFMVCQACDIRGGVIMHLSGPTTRYCLRELQYRSMMGEGVEYNPVTGMEFVAVLNRAEIYRRTGKFPNAVNKPQN
ncbi:MAG: hypothetical protein ABFD92_01105 [Planctomycetaceae bacterium]|nr:hypothetical protein [Planctomycetaceae bacterium]